MFLNRCYIFKKLFKLPSSNQLIEILFSLEQELGMRSAVKSLLMALPFTMRPTLKIHYFARSVK